MFKNYSFLRLFTLFIFLTAGSWIYGLKSFVDGTSAQVEDTSSETDAIVALTGGSGRLQEAIRLLNEGRAKKLFISGVSKETNLATILILSGNLPENIAQLVDRIELGYEAQDTKGNAAEVLSWLKENNYKTIRLVTANYHMKRSMVEFSSLSPEITIVPHPVFPEDLVLNRWWENGAAKKVLVSEYNKYIVSKIHSWL